MIGDACGPRPRLCKELHHVITLNLVYSYTRPPWKMFSCGQDLINTVPMEIEISRGFLGRRMCATAWMDVA